MSKTINYKEKYEKALERARVYWENDNDNTLSIKAKGTMEYLFPELAESEDERIIKEIIQSIKGSMIVIHKDKCLAWLEKVDKDNKFLKSIKVGDILVKSPDGILINLGQSDRVLEHHDKFKASDWYVSKVDGKIHNIYYSDDKPEPKFKVGNWITDGKAKHYVTNYTNDDYELQATDGRIFYSSRNLVESYYHLWSIEDAKEGDILANDNVICVYKECVSEHLIKVTINYSRKEDIETHYDTIGDSDLHPATKSQRDFFISKILQSK